MLATSRICVANFGKIGIQICTIFGIREMSTGNTEKSLSIDRERGAVLFAILRKHFLYVPVFAISHLLSPRTKRHAWNFSSICGFETLLHFIRPHAVLVPTPPFLVYFVNPDMALSHSQKPCTERTVLQRVPRGLFVPIYTRHYARIHVDRN